MTIQKKSLLSTLNTTKKAIVASTPATANVEPATKSLASHSPAVRAPARRSPARRSPAMRSPAKRG
ncbi:MAG TPA: hypothetical protein VKV39_11820 [Candidatus Sulfotelmatobacter sp.]|nr:hypothetical protein [Candidatus Sulfotelmatobacter sp.]